MSIYSSTFEVGTNEYNDMEHPEEFGVHPGIVLVRCDNGCNHYPDPSTGIVLVRCDNGCNHYPDPSTCREGSIDGALIPAYCVNGHENTEYDDEFSTVGGWYRLGVSADGHGYVQMLLDVNAVRALHHDLTKWLQFDKVEPK